MRTEAERNQAKAEQTNAEMRQRQAEMQKTQAEMQKSQAELRESQRETDRQMKETDRRLRKAENLFTTQWGRLMESLVEGDLVALLQDRGIAVEGTARETAKRRNGEHFEIDIIAVNGTEVVAVEVKATLRSEGVTHFAGKLSRFLEWWPEFSGRRIYGAVAYLRGSADVTAYAERQGLFVIRATGNSASIVNGADFKPRAFG